MKSNETFKYAQASPSQNIKNKMPSKQNPRNRSGNRPTPNTQQHKIHNLHIANTDPPIDKTGAKSDPDQSIGEGGSGEVNESGNEANPRGVTTGEGEEIDRNGDAHVLVVVRSGSPDEDFEKAGEGKVEKEAEEERD